MPTEHETVLTLPLLRRRKDKDSIVPAFMHRAMSTLSVNQTDVSDQFRALWEKAAVPKGQESGWAPGVVSRFGEEKVFANTAEQLSRKTSAPKRHRILMEWRTVRGEKCDNPQGSGSAGEVIGGYNKFGGESRNAYRSLEDSLSRKQQFCNTGDEMEILNEICGQRDKQMPCANELTSNS
jgi:hypothetical protein